MAAEARPSRTGETGACLHPTPSARQSSTGRCCRRRATCLFYIALCPDSTAKDIARGIGHTERQIWSMIGNLKDADMLRVRRIGRRHHFTINFDVPLLHPVMEDISLRSLMESAVEQVRGEDLDLCADDDARLRRTRA